MDGAFDTYWQSPSTSPEQLQHINDALDATLNPRVSNDIRQQALQHLEQVKSQADAPQYGFALADDWKQNEAVRYYGLQLLEYGVRYRWSEYTTEQSEQVRTWVKCLAGSIREQDALFVRNKVAQLWAEVAKRSWGDEWMNMDSQLVSLWEKPVAEKGTANKVFVLYILETLSEDIINSEDAVAGLRLEILGAALNEIVIPRGLYEEHNKVRSSKPEVRHGEEGWLARICAFFAFCAKQVRMGGSPDLLRSTSVCAVKALHALRPTMTWISLKAVVEVSCIDCLFLPFHVEDIALQIAATEVLYALLARTYNAHFHDAWTTLLQQSLQSDKVALLKHIFEHTASAPGEDDAKYTLHKRLSEVVSLQADAIAQHPELIAQDVDLDAFFDLLLFVLQSKSLYVSIPVLSSWSKLIGVQDGAVIDLVLQALGVLLQTCSERLLPYESLPADFENESTQYLDEDFDTMPERHAFLGNYRRYCTSIIQAIGRSRPLEALQHVLGQMSNMLQTGPYTGGRGFDPAKYSQSSIPVLEFDAQFNVVTSALKGFSLWCTDVSALAPTDSLHQQGEIDKANASKALEDWSRDVINIHVDDPEVAAQVLQTLVLVLRTIVPTPAFVLHVVQHLLTMRLYDDPAHTNFSTTVKHFEALRVVELQKLALVFSNELLEVYHELEPRIGVLVQKHESDLRLVWGYKAFLFMIVHRAKVIDHDTRMSRLQQLLDPVYQAWQDPGLKDSVASFQAFCDALGLGNIADFYRQNQFDQVQDWSAQQLDAAGVARQTEIKERSDQLPFRMTKTMLAATTEKLQVGTDEFENASALWADIIPIILPNLLELLKYAQAFHNMSNWSHLPEKLQAVVRRTLQDRFWQSGISSETKDQFYARISGSKESYEGFASVVRGTMRNIREQGYHMLYLMTKFEEQFYGISDLAHPLADALYGNAESLTANNLHPIISATTGLIQRCPPQYRNAFLPPLLTQLFAKFDAKISAEWEAIAAASQRSVVDGEDELSDEMRGESVLRQLSYSMVSMVPYLLEFDRQQSSHPHHQKNGHIQSQSLSHIVLRDPTVLEPMILFCTHALRMRDTRCCLMICKAFRFIIPVFQGDEAPAPQVREFISTEVLKACITSLNEPYFADMQKDLAALIAQVVVLYAPKTETVKSVLYSLPDIRPDKVNKAVEKISRTQNERQQRAVILDLLEGVRGVSIYEAGKITQPLSAKKRGKGGMQQQYMEVEQRPTITNGEEQGLDGLAGLFADE